MNELNEWMNVQQIIHILFVKIYALLQSHCMNKYFINVKFICSLEISLSLPR